MAEGVAETLKEKKGSILLAMLVVFILIGMIAGGAWLARGGNPEGIIGSISGKIDSVFGGASGEVQGGVNGVVSWVKEKIDNTKKSFKDSSGITKFGDIFPIILHALIMFVVAISIIKAISSDENKNNKTDVIKYIGVALFSIIFAALLHKTHPGFIWTADFWNTSDTFKIALEYFKSGKAWLNFSVITIVLGLIIEFYGNKISAKLGINSDNKNSNVFKWIFVILITLIITYNIGPDQYIYNQETFKTVEEFTLGYRTDSNQNIFDKSGNVINEATGSSTGAPLEIPTPPEGETTSETEKETTSKPELPPFRFGQHTGWSTDKNGKARFGILWFGKAEHPQGKDLGLSNILVLALTLAFLSIIAQKVVGSSNQMSPWLIFPLALLLSTNMVSHGTISLLSIKSYIHFGIGLITYFSLQSMEKNFPLRMYLSYLAGKIASGIFSPEGFIFSPWATLGFILMWAIIGKFATFGWDIGSTAGKEYIGGRLNKYVKKKLEGEETGTGARLIGDTEVDLNNALILRLRKLRAKERSATGLTIAEAEEIERIQDELTIRGIEFKT